MPRAHWDAVGAGFALRLARRRGFGEKALCPKQQRRHEQELFLFGQLQRGGARHSGAPMLRRYAATSDFLLSMAHLRAVLPELLDLQGR
jgi:hypothetical protein